MKHLPSPAYLQRWRVTTFLQEWIGFSMGRDLPDENIPSFIWRLRERSEIIEIAVRIAHFGMRVVLLLPTGVANFKFIFFK
jgi:hypothetical protein